MLKLLYGALALAVLLLMFAGVLYFYAFIGVSALRWMGVDI